jgi:type III secretion protein D
MKQLRILTGSHAGAQIRLVPGDYRVGPDDAADICVTDWRDSDIVFSLDAEGVLRWKQAPGAAAESTVTLVPDLIPIPFGDVVLAAGPEDDSWPSDVDLLRMLWMKPEAPATAEQAAKATQAAPGANKRRVAGPLVGALIGAGMVGALLITGVTLFVGAPREADAMADPRTLTTRIATELRAAGIAGLDVAPHGPAVVVTGMVRNAAEDVAARGVFARVAPDQNHVLRHYDVAEEDCRSLKDALGVPAVQVSYQGDGVFQVTGAVPSMSAFEAALAHAKSDLDQNVKRIDVKVSETRHSVPEPKYSEVISISGVRYVETPDGVKHLYPQAEGTSSATSPSDL